MTQREQARNVTESKSYLCKSALCLPCRALGEYATTNNAASESAAKDLVNKTFGTIQEFDFQLFSAARNKQPVGKEAAVRLQQAVGAMDDLLATVPADSMSKARASCLSSSTFQLHSLITIHVHV